MTVSYDSLLPCQSLRVAIMGAGNVGRTLAQRIIEKNLANVVLLDVIEGLPQGVALDLMEAQGLEQHNCEVMGTNDYQETADADIVVITAGRARTPGIRRDDLLAINAKIVAEVAQKAFKYSPNAIFIVITNPLDVMTYLTQKVTGLPPQRVMGMAGVLDSSRLRTFLAMELGVSTANVTAMVLGGHGDLMVPLPAYCTVNGISITQLLDDKTIERLLERTRNGGAEVVKLLKTGGAYYAPASSACIMIETILKNQSRLLPTAAYLQGEYGLNDIYIGVPSVLACGGVKKILEVKLTPQEQEALLVSATSVRKNVNLALKSLA